jgi:hypothetical protein
VSKTIQQVLEHIQHTEGRIFSIRFIKRTNGETREMLCRTGVKKYLVNDPKKPGLNFSAHGLIPVYDMQAEDPEKGYRSIPIEGITEIKMHGEWETVNHQPRWYLHSCDVRDNFVIVRARLDDKVIFGKIIELHTDEWASLFKLALQPFNGQELAKSAEISGIQPIPLPFDMYGRIASFDSGQS